MAPEQFRNAKNADARCDIYSLAATLYMMVTGELPFKSLGPLEAWMKKLENKITPPRELVPTLSERVDWAIRRAMTPDPNQRPSSCHEFIEDLTGQSTRRLTPLTQMLFKEIWYLRFKDDNGVIHTIKDNIAGIRQALMEDRLGEICNLRASKSQNGPFEPLKKHPEFRDLILVTESTPIAKIQQSMTSSPSQTPLPLNQPPLKVSSNAALARPAAATPMPAKPPIAGGSGLLPTPPAPAKAAPAPAPVLAPSVPHVELETSTSQHEWLQFVLLVVVALIAGAASFFLLPMFMK
jgi:serine/threonine protein kinase